MIFRTAYRGDSACQDKTRRRPLSGADDMPGQNAAQAAFRTAYRGDSAGQDKPAQMIFRTKRGAGGYQDGLLGDSAGQDKAQFDMPGQNAAPIQDGLPGGFSLPGQNAAQAVIRTAYRGDSACQDKPAQMIFQDKAQMIFRTAYRGDSACQDKPAQMIFQDKTRRRPLSGQGADDIQDGLPGGFSLPGQNAAQAVIRAAYRGDSAGQDKLAQFDMPGQSRGAGRFQDRAQMIFRTKRGAGGYQAQAQMICQDKTRRRPLSGRLTGGIQPARTKPRRRRR